MKKFGNSKVFINSAAHALKGTGYFTSKLSKSLDVAHQVAGCDYEYGSDWGKKVGGKLVLRTNFLTSVSVIYLFIFRIDDTTIDLLCRSALTYTLLLVSFLIHMQSIPFKCWLRALDI